MHGWRGRGSLSPGLERLVWFLEIGIMGEHSEDDSVPCFGGLVVFTG